MSRASATSRVRTALENRVALRTWQGERIAARLHMTSPRGGVNLNRFGQPRSAPGEPPAVETGHLLSRILNGTVISGMRGEFVANYVVLEYGYNVGTRSRISDRRVLASGRVEPRPNGRLTIEQMKREEPVAVSG